MALNCRIDNGNVYAPNGELSVLYNKLESRFGEGKALELYSLTETLEYKDMLSLDVDRNGEMEEDNFLRFALESEQPTLNVSNTIDFLQRFQPEQINRLDSLYVQGVFQPTYNNLKNTNIFSEDEIFEILYSQEKQNNLKNFIENFTDLNISQVEDFRELQSDYNDIGIKPLMNPNEVREEVLNIISEATTPQEVNDLMQTIEYPNVKERYNTDEDFKNYIDDLAINSYKIDSIRDRDNTYNTLLETVDVESFGDISDTTQRIEQLTDKELIVEEFDIIVDNLIQAGVEIEFDELELMSRSIGELKSFSKTLQDFVNNPTQQTTRDFAQQVDIFRNFPETKITYLPNLNNKNPNTLRYLDTIKNEVEVFEQYNLVKVKDNVYQRVNTNISNEQLYDIIYSQIIQNPEKLPIEISEDRNQTIDNIQNYLQKNSLSLPNTDIETKEKINLYKAIYNTEFTKNETKTPTGEVENQDYLRNQFISDFNKYRLSEKKEGTENYNNFFKFFTVDQKGITLIDNSKYTMDRVLNNIPSDISTNLLNYSLLSNSLDLGIEQQIDPSVEDRLNAQQNPHLLPIFEGDYQIVSADEIIAPNEEQFFTIRGNSYEKTISYGNRALYKQLPQSNGIFKSTQIEKPLTDKTAEFVKEFTPTKENTTTNKKYLNKEELNSINEKYFECE